MDVLFLSASTGEGHTKAAEAVKEQLELEYPGSRTMIINALKYASPIADRLIVGNYLHTIRNTPHIYGKLYKLSELDESITNMTKTLSNILSISLLNIIEEFKPSVIVCTHTIPLQMVSSLKRKGKLNIPAVGIVTDFVNHTFWKLDNIEAFIVAHEYIKNDMIDMGISGGRIYPYGIPVSKNFLSRREKSIIRKELDFESKLTALIMGGSLGLGKIRKTFESLLSSSRIEQVIVVTGRNIKLRRQLENDCINNNKKVRTLGYTDRVADLMDASDLIITKPGGMTISEALVKELPIFITSPLPGQEEKNAHFLINTGVAARIFPGDDIDGIICQTLDNPVRKRHMKEMAHILAKPEAAKNTVSLLEKLSCGFSVKTPF